MNSNATSELPFDRVQRLSRASRASTWYWLADLSPDKRHVVLLTRLKLSSFWRISGLTKYGRTIANQMTASPGLVGFAHLPQATRLCYWTLSIWGDEKSARGFIECVATARASRELDATVGRTRFFRWTAMGARLPPSWSDAMERWTNG